MLIVLIHIISFGSAVVCIYMLSCQEKKNAARSLHKHFSVSKTEMNTVNLKTERKQKKMVCHCISRKKRSSAETELILRIL